MKSMYQLLANLGRLWNQDPNAVPTLTLTQGTGQYGRVSIDQGVMYLHSGVYRADMPVRQTITLQGMSLTDLVATLQSMGYVASLTSEVGSLVSSQALNLIDVQNVDFDTTLSAFTSPLWKLFYPLNRLLNRTEGDMDLAIQQMTMPSSSGSWIDYWAGFINFVRNIGEADSDFLRRIYAYLFNPDVNNIALQELIKFRLSTDNVQVNDLSPLNFEVVTDPKWMGNSSDIDTILMQTKSAGVDYLYHYLGNYAENYEAYLSDKTGENFHNVDGMPMVALGFTEAQYGYQPSTTEFTINQSNLDGSDTLGGSVYRMADTYTVTIVAPTYSEVYTTDSDLLLPFTVNAVFADLYPHPTEGATTGNSTIPSGYENYRYPYGTGFTLNSSSIMSSTSEDGIMPDSLHETASMTLNDSSGNIIQQATF